MYSEIKELLSDMSRGQGLFSPFAFKSEKRLARKVGPAIASAGASAYGARSRGAASKYTTDQQRFGGMAIQKENDSATLTRLLEEDEINERSQNRAIKGQKDVQAQINAGALALSRNRGKNAIGAIKETGYWQNMNDKDRSLLEKELWGEDPLSMFSTQSESNRNAPLFNW